jgi:hypothetical protein
MHPEVSALVAMLEEAVSLFRRHGMGNWAAWLEKDVRLIGESDFYGVQHLLSAYGGMGSLNDIGLAEADPEEPGFLRTHADDSRLQELICAIHSSALKL